MTIIRFKSIFDVDKVHHEIRVILNKDNKISGFWIKQWLDEPM